MGKNYYTFVNYPWRNLVKQISFLVIIGLGTMLFFGCNQEQTLSNSLGNGIAMSGLEDSQGTINPKLGENYTKNPDSNYVLVEQIGFKHVKIAFDWQALEPTLGKKFNGEYLTHIQEQVSLAKNHNLKVILDMHNFARRGGEEKGLVIGKQISIGDFARTWKQLSSVFIQNDTVVAYNLMTEPFEMPTPTTPQNYSSSSTATQMYQKAVDEIRENGDKKLLIVQLDQWASIANFTANYGTDPKPWIIDPENKVLYEAHHYFDSNRSGYYKGEGINLKTSIETLKNEAKPYLDWCKRHNLKAYVGEIGIPNTPQLQPVLKEYLQFLRSNNANWTYWTMGVSGWYNSPTGVAPKTINRETKKSNGDIAPQLETLKEFL